MIINGTNKIFRNEYEIIKKRNQVVINSKIPKFMNLENLSRSVATKIIGKLSINRYLLQQKWPEAYQTGISSSNSPLISFHRFGNISPSFYSIQILIKTWIHLIFFFSKDFKTNFPYKALSTFDYTNQSF